LLSILVRTCYVTWLQPKRHAVAWGRRFGLGTNQQAGPKVKGSLCLQTNKRKQSKCL
jgi:hypothetical protein